MKQSIVSEVMQEVVIYGGLPARRCDVYDHALRTLRTRIGADNGGKPVSEQDCRRAAEMFAFGFNTKLAPEGTMPLTLTELMALD